MCVQLEDQLSQRSYVPLHRDFCTKLRRVVLSDETKHSVCLSLFEYIYKCLCGFLSFVSNHSPTDLECVQRPYYKKFLFCSLVLSSPCPLFSLCQRRLGHKKEKSLGHFQNDFRCSISAFGRMQLGTCQEREEINYPRVSA